MRIDKKSTVEVLHWEHAFSDMFVAYLLTRNIRYEAAWLTSFSIPARSDLLAFSSWLLTSVRMESPKL